MTYVLCYGARQSGTPTIQEISRIWAVAEETLGSVTLGMLWYRALSIIKKRAVMNSSVMPRDSA